MKDTLGPGVIVKIPEPFTYQIRLGDGRHVRAQPSRLHFGNRPDDLEWLQALAPGSAVTVRMDAADPAAGWLVRAVRTAEGWRGCGDPAVLLESVRDAADERRLRLFACACCRAVWDLLPEGPHRRLVEVIEAYADGQAGAAELGAALAAGGEEERSVSGCAEEAEEDPVHGPRLGAIAKAVWATRSAAYPAASADVFEVALDAARSCVGAAVLRATAQAAATKPAPADVVAGVRAAAEATALSSQADVVRELFGNPFETVQADPSWRTAPVVELARSIYTGGDFGRLPELAAALEAAGCAAGHVLDHCRTPRGHVRGCWVLDLLLGHEPAVSDQSA